ncbi:ABC transporter ATP-binding protein [Pseudooceanicola lipolyticus]|uniref:ABC transporter ATP-binding protein n=1 Tax=Pseudooceanicola lipolyticus TaxID=2029104 RepID=UPI001F0C88E8|nr:TOBE domain-containing protein [Pseudooceanicola lipolyticus]
MDEPLSALDAKIRVSLRDDIRSIQRELGITTIFVAHDQEEALSISDRVVVMYQGRADQIGVPAEIDNRPDTRFVAGFVGHLNTFEAQVGENGAVRFAGHSLPGKAATLRAGAAVTVALRPETLSLAPRNGDDLRVEGRVLHTSFLGSVIRAQVEVAGQAVSVDLFNQSNGGDLPQPGQDRALWFSRDDLLVLPA